MNVQHGPRIIIVQVVLVLILLLGLLIILALVYVLQANVHTVLVYLFAPQIVQEKTVAVMVVVALVVLALHQTTSAILINLAKENGL